MSVSLQITQTLDHDLDCFLNQAGSISDIAVDCRAIEQETPEGHSSDARAWWLLECHELTAANTPLCSQMLAIFACNCREGVWRMSNREVYTSCCTRRTLPISCNRRGMWELRGRVRTSTNQSIPVFNILHVACWLWTIITELIGKNLWNSISHESMTQCILLDLYKVGV